MRIRAVNNKTGEGRLFKVKGRELLIGSDVVLEVEAVRAQHIIVDITEKEFPTRSKWLLTRLRKMVESDFC